MANFHNSRDVYRRSVTMAPLLKGNNLNSMYFRIAKYKIKHPQAKTGHTLA